MPGSTFHVPAVHPLFVVLFWVGLVAVIALVGHSLEGWSREIERPRMEFMKQCVLEEKLPERTCNERWWWMHQ